jgi:hypothetical protein
MTKRAQRTSRTFASAPIRHSASRKSIALAINEARILVSSKFACSVTFRVRQSKRLHARLTYEGKTVYQYTTRLLGKGVCDSWISENIGSTPLPGGPWKCRFSFGSAQAGASFRSGGPTGAVIGAAVCAARHSLIYAHRRIRVCKSDESTRPIRTTTRILCSAVFVKQVGKMAEVRLLSGGNDAATPDVGRVPAPVSISWTIFSPATPAADGTFAAGEYACLFSVNGISVVEKPFQIISGPNAGATRFADGGALYAPPAVGRSGAASDCPTCPQREFGTPATEPLPLARPRARTNAS